MSPVMSATCWTPGPRLYSRYSSIWLFFLPSAGSLIGNLHLPVPFSMTFDIRALYSVEMSSSVKWARFENPRTFSYPRHQCSMSPR